MLASLVLINSGLRYLVYKVSITWICSIGSIAQVASGAKLHMIVG